MGMKYLLVLCSLVWIAEAQPEGKVFNVKSYGAIADAKTDNSGAFLKAWNEACKWNGNAIVLIPEGTYMLNQVMFVGPCKGWTNFRIRGVLKASTDLSSYKNENWINFRYVNHLIVNGGGTLDGQGSSAWTECQNNRNCRPLPTTMKFDFITNSKVHRLHSINSKQTHFMLFACENIALTKLEISAPADSPNTDGIKIGESSGVNITSVNIGTGDDCISIISGTKKVRVMDVFCGPGHGISVGSLGKNDWEKDVDDIVVKNCTFRGTSNGVRIKTWASPLKKTLKASNFVYEDFVMENVENPIIIDQEYCPYPPCNTQVVSNVQISNVRYTNIRGSSNTEIAANFKCSKSKPCQNVTLDNIHLTRSGGKGGISNSCKYVNGASYGQQIPPSCLK